jgi:thymidylate kinase
MKSVVSDTDYGMQLRKLIRAGDPRSLELLYLSDLALDEVRVRDFTASGGVVRDKTYASSLAHIRAHGMVNGDDLVKTAVTTFFETVARLARKPDVVVFLKASAEVVRGRMKSKTDVSAWDCRLAGDPDAYARQGCELEGELRRAYGDRMTVVDTDDKSVEDVCVAVKRIAGGINDGGS